MFLPFKVHRQLQGADPIRNRRMSLGQPDIQPIIQSHVIFMLFPKVAQVRDGGCPNQPRIDLMLEATQMSALSTPCLAARRTWVEEALTCLMFLWLGYQVEQGIKLSRISQIGFIVALNTTQTIGTILSTGILWCWSQRRGDRIRMTSRVVDRT